MKTKLPLLIILGLLGGAGFVRAQEAASKPAIFVCGDSTAKNSGAGKNGQPMVGWGTPIADFFDPEKAVVKNVGHAGKSSLTYYTGDWPKVLPQINKGDYVLLVFGINDGGTPPGIGDETVTRNGQPVHTYGWYMSKMATDAEAKGAQVILLTVTTRNIWSNPKVKYRDGTPIDPLPADYDPKLDKIERGTSGGKFTQWTKDVGAKLHLPVFDLTDFCADKYEAMGREKVNALYSDHNHTYMPGAEIVAASIVSGLKAFNNSPFIPLLSEKGRAVEPADAKYVSDNITPLLRSRVGRLLNDKMPTGVAVTPAMNHGGPFPATGHPGFTAVGIPAALRRFAMLQCFDNVRPARLPIALQNKNPNGKMWRLIDGNWSQGDVAS
jgi:lysophospholipase L1-like esterase